ncbi:MAG: XdhC family protein [Bermanella sp.]
MQNSQLEVLLGCLECLQQGQQMTLVSVAKTWGTSPRPVGALLAVSSEGRFFGSVSGGCVEEDLIEQLKLNPASTPHIMIYGETQEQRHRFGLPCGGALELVVEPFNDIAEVQKLIEAIEQRHSLYRSVSLNDGEISHKSLQAEHNPNLDDQVWSNVFGPLWQMIIVGAGETGRYLAEMALALGYQVLVSDPRPEYRRNWPMKNIELLPGFPDDVLDSLAIDHRSVIVTVAHDPKVDDMALLSALKSSAFYVGSLGSKVNNQNRRERLMEHFGFSLKEVNRLQGPVGLPIGSKTPPEIALAILAEVTALRNGIDIKSQLNLNQKVQEALA